MANRKMNRLAYNQLYNEPQIKPHPSEDSSDHWNWHWKYKKHC